MMNTKNKKIIITGGEGMLADYFKRFAKNRRIIYLTRKELDVSKWKDVKKLLDMSLTAIIHLAAKTDVDWCEINQKQAYEVNTLGAKYMVSIAKSKKIPLIFTSTSAVFDGKSAVSYREFDKPHPANYYAETKFESEKIIQKELTQYAIIRLGWLIGKEKKFLSYILKQINEGKNELRVVDDIKGTITYAYDTVRFIEKIIANNDQGLFHLASKGSCTRYDIAEKILKLMRKRIKLVPVKHKDFAVNFPAPRPKNESIISTKKIKGFKALPTWDETIERIYALEKF